MNQISPALAEPQQTNEHLVPSFKQEYKASSLSLKVGSSLKANTKDTFILFCQHSDNILPFAGQCTRTNQDDLS